ncbi:hypothetical protein ABNN70_02760 [Sporolactobacillus sp. Y61]|uniref:Adhesin n=1 Tax=Sporolactobacillus sp. Y61 TaxID=3160863 RepID=A0AAU8IHN4_9BACL
MLQVTDEAKEILSQSMEEHNCDCLRVDTQPGCCGVSLRFALDHKKSGEQPTPINGVPVIMNQETGQQTDSLTISVVDGSLVIDGGGCGCGPSGCC